MYRLLISDCGKPQPGNEIMDLEHQVSLGPSSCEINIEDVWVPLGGFIDCANLF